MIANTNNNKNKGWKKVIQSKNTKQPGILQRGRNATYQWSSAVGRALACLQPHKTKVQFAKEVKTRRFNKEDKPAKKGIRTIKTK